MFPHLSLINSITIERCNGQGAGLRMNRHKAPRLVHFLR